MTRHARHMTGFVVVLLVSGCGSAQFSNRAQAVSWYRKAAAAGFEPAAKRLRALGEEQL